MQQATNQQCCGAFEFQKWWKFVAVIAAISLLVDAAKRWWYWLTQFNGRVRLENRKEKYPLIVKQATRQYVCNNMCGGIILGKMVL